MDKQCTEICNTNTSLCICMRDKIRRIVITGGPCCGKTTLLNNLAAQSYSVVPEAARMIIGQEQRRDSENLPWRDLYAFQKITAERILELEHSFSDSLLFCDRGIIDGHAYATRGRVQTPDIVRSSHGRYDLVFILDPIPDYKKDESRRENPQEARDIHAGIMRAYREFGYRPIVVPVMAPTDRAKYFARLVEGAL